MIHGASAVATTAARVVMQPLRRLHISIAMLATLLGVAGLTLPTTFRETELDLPTGRATVSVCMDNVKTSCATPQKIAHELLSGIAQLHAAPPQSC